jgi:hypothetical protein
MIQSCFECVCVCMYACMYVRTGPRTVRYIGTHVHTYTHRPSPRWPLAAVPYHVRALGWRRRQGCWERDMHALFPSPPLLPMRMRPSRPALSCQLNRCRGPICKQELDGILHSYRLHVIVYLIHLIYLIYNITGGQYYIITYGAMPN